MAQAASCLAIGPLAFDGDDLIIYDADRQYKEPGN
jgi:hypothetical protein